MTAPITTGTILSVSDSTRRAVTRAKKHPTRASKDDRNDRDDTAGNDRDDVSLLIRAQAEEIASLVAPRTGRPGIESDTPTVHKFLAAVCDGNYISTACAVAGISRQAWHNVKTRAEAGETAAQALVDAAQKAEAFAEAEMVGCVRNAARKGPQYWAAGMTMLERRHPDRFGKRLDDAQVPRVVVQIGSNVQDVSISIADTQNIIPPSDNAIDVTPTR